MTRDDTHIVDIDLTHVRTHIKNHTARTSEGAAAIGVRRVQMQGIRLPIVPQG